MTYLPKYAFPAKSVISTISSESVGAALFQSSGSRPAANAWPSANLGFYIPFRLNQYILVQSLWLLNGTSTTGNVNIGIYSQDGTRLVSTGATAQSGTTTLQNISITALGIGPGKYFLALSESSTSSIVYTVVPSNVMQLSMMGIYTQASVGTLPATATFATPSNAAIPVFGLATVSTV